MIYIKVESNGFVSHTHNFPLDPDIGMGKTKEELLMTGYLVEEKPQPEHRSGFNAVEYYNKETNEIYFKYEQSEAGFDSEKITELETANELLTESLIDFKMQYTSVPCQLHQEYPAIVDGLIEGAKTDGTV